MVLMLSGKNAVAQSAGEKPVNLTVMTLDRATLVSAGIYAVQPGVDCFVDSAHLDEAYTGTAVWIDTLAHDSLSIQNGYDISGYADSVVYTTSFVLAKDANGRYYVLGGGTDRSLGVFQATAQMLGRDTLDNLGYPMTVSQMLLDNNAVIEDNATVRTSPIDSTGWYYSNMSSALFWANLSQGISQLTFLDTVKIGGPTSYTISNSLTINQNGKPLVNNKPVTAFIINGSDVSWEGGTTTINSTSQNGGLFELIDGSLMIRNITANGGSTVVRLTNGSYLSADMCTFNIDSAGAAIIFVGDSSRAEIGNMNFYGDANTNTAVAFATGATATLDILEATVQNRMNGLTIGGNAYVKRSNGHRMYSRTMQIVADSANNDTVYLNMNIAGSDLITSPAVIQLGEGSVNQLYVSHSTGTLEILGGKVNVLFGAPGSDAALKLNIDSLASFTPGAHETTIEGGRYVNFANATGDPITIKGGKFANRYDDYLASRYFFEANTDADAAIFPWKISQGYRVTWKNWNYFNDSTIVYNNSNNKIEPPLSADTHFLSSDTTFIAWWVDSAFTHPWDFLNDTLSSDTTLYSEWHIFNPLVEAYYRVYHKRIGLDYADTLTDVITRYDTIGNTVVVHALNYAWYHPVGNINTITIGPLTQDTTVEFYYVRDTFQFGWNLMGGHFADNTPMTMSLAWGTPIDYSSVPVRPGHVFSHWVDSVATMPHANHVVTAVWDEIIYPVTWTGSSAAVVYTSEPIDVLVATYTHDGVTDTALLRYTNLSNGSTSALPVLAGNYKVEAMPLTPDYHLDSVTATSYITVQRATVSIDSFAVEKDKFFDGTDSATITHYANIDGVLGNDDLALANVRARYNDAAIGEDKSIIVFYYLGGTDADNYVLDTNLYLAATDAAIIAPFLPDEAEEGSQEGIGIRIDGYCVGSDTLHYYLMSGTPDEYKLLFSEEAIGQGFSNDTNWQTLDTANRIILMDIPADALHGIYTAKVLFRNSNHPDLVSDTSEFGFNVNLPSIYTMPLFSDVIALVDTCHCFSDIYWFHSTDGGATWDTVASNVYYYQEIGGLTGEYRVVANMNGMAVASCAQSDVTTLLSDDEAPATVSIYPNPATDRATIGITGSRVNSHTVKVMSIMGVEMLNATFEGDSYQLDFSGYANGSYTVSVDGTVVRVIKK